MLATQGPHPPAWPLRPTTQPRLKAWAPSGTGPGRQCSPSPPLARHRVAGKLESCEGCAAAFAKEGHSRQLTGRRQAEHQHSGRGGVVGGIAQRGRVRIRLQPNLRKPTTKRTSKSIVAHKQTVVEAHGVEAVPEHQLGQRHRYPPLHRPLHPARPCPYPHRSTSAQAAEIPSDRLVFASTVLRRGERALHRQLCATQKPHSPSQLNMLCV